MATIPEQYEITVRRVGLRWWATTYRPYFYTEDTGLGRSRITYVSVRDERGDIVGTGLGAHAAWQEALGTLRRRAGSGLK